MVSFGQRLENEFYSSAWAIPCNALFHGLGGAVYATCVNLPLEKAAKAYAIWGAVEEVFHHLAMLATDDPKKRAMLKVCVFSISNILGITKLREMGLMGDKFAICVAILQLYINFQNLKVNHVI